MTAEPVALTSLSVRPELHHSTAEAALALDIATRWNVDDASLVILQYGMPAVATIHRRMLRLARQQKLHSVRNLGGYFMRSLLNLSARKAGPTPEQQDAALRSDDFIDRYIERQRARGQEAQA